jgi:outer membrane biosynthesis protein TonB
MVAQQQFKTSIHKGQDRSKAAIASFLFHAALLAMIFFYRFSAQPAAEELPAIVMDWGGGGDNAAAGLPDEGQGNDPAPQGQQMEDPTSTETSEKPVSTPTPPTPTPPTKTSPNEAPKNTPTTDDPNIAAIKKQQEETKRKQQEQDQIRKQQEEERQRIADAKRREQEERDAKKGKFGSTFGKPGSTGTGQGNTGKPGNQGIPGGTGDNPFGKSNGTGGGTGGGDGTGTGASVGGGLGGRAIKSRGRISDDSQKSGRVVIEVCVDGEGNVVSATYTQRGSTTSDSELRGKAIAAAKQYRFGTSTASQECGTITFNFQLK